jgi:hypothetical protein
VPDAFGKALLLVVLPLSASAIAGVYFSFLPEILPRAIAFVVCAIWAIAVVVMTVTAALRMRWRRCLGLIAALLIVLPMSFVLAFWTGDYVHLAVMWPSYQSAIQNEPGRRVTFEWVTVEMMFGQMARTLVYAPSDSEAHKQDIPYNDYDGTFMLHRHLMGHFYLIESNP